MSRFGPRGPRRRYAASPPRSLWRKLLDYGLAALILGLLILVAARLDRFERRTEQGTAIINDGDSITLGAERVRMRGIDAPEYLQNCRQNGADYACGKLARQSLVKLIGGRPVSCSGWQRDRYGRLLGDCRAGDTDLNRAQVQAGWAVAFGDFETEEAAARAAKVGIWAGTFEEPRDWRDSHHDAPVERKHGMLASVGDVLREFIRFW
ncbi:thermonuclease family protein [Mesorhizobium sp. M2D.F.Ca.ET.185.01.1.1]|uniref:thermonuclease family protein n=1 Tax=unclassified Mesorhizobium TaxID=325217 RepID=UPI000FC99C31|nr:MULTISPECIES: thermonuclease family protein [unclassified Mesorhizobium]TGP81003.1 thermonuclease family protein [bacterium M00.F.Ca.ET.227.01.1.1]TGP90786.1 thermonuclease family protein [bacterium M00.F.Ca.ET.221.01.1.1]TGP97465.1 thermonuclease family protein [bacterium M00.F.Ca.ET.222.01.1.1]TGT73249.1 thermonuclease family protein [bacterium M00.F.Ca.ET.159.01.1.1]TGT84088.1 thermonuclease family protein [bacterium M00.F.Ca.ET.157.01.1.1]TGU07966.1 thermonuclease family protein [bacte